jgi:hypothetical protein
MRISIVVKDIRNAELTKRDYQSVFCVASGKLIDDRIGLLRFTSEVDGLPKKGAGYARGGIIASNLVGLTAWKSCDPERIA